MNGGQAHGPTWEGTSGWPCSPKLRPGRQDCGRGALGPGRGTGGVHAPRGCPTPTRLTPTCHSGVCAPVQVSALSSFWQEPGNSALLSALPRAQGLRGLGDAKTGPCREALTAWGAGRTPLLPLQGWTPSSVQLASRGPKIRQPQSPQSWEAEAREETFSREEAAGGTMPAPHPRGRLGPQRHLTPLRGVWVSAAGPLRAEEQCPACVLAAGPPQEPWPPAPRDVRSAIGHQRWPGRVGECRRPARAGGRGAGRRRGHGPPPPAPARAGSAQAPGPAPRDAPGTPSSPRGASQRRSGSRARTTHTRVRKRRPSRSRQNPDSEAAAAGPTWGSRRPSGTPGGGTDTPRGTRRRGKGPGPKGQVLCDSLL